MAVWPVLFVLGKYADSLKSRRVSLRVLVKKKKLEIEKSWIELKTGRRGGGERGGGWQGGQEGGAGGGGRIWQGENLNVSPVS